jgi:hypothetical protein
MPPYGGIFSARPTAASKQEQLDTKPAQPESSENKRGYFLNAGRPAQADHNEKKDNSDGPKPPRRGGFLGGGRK